MDQHRVIRVQIDHPQPSVSADYARSARYIGFLGAELNELEEALGAGKHLEFSWLPWAAKSKETVVKTVTPSQPVTPGALEFQQQVHADLLRLIGVLEEMSKLMAGQAPQPMPAPAALPISSSVAPALRPAMVTLGQVMPKNGGSIYTVSSQVMSQNPPPLALPLSTPSIQGLVNGRQAQYSPSAGYAV